MHGGGEGRLLACEAETLLRYSVRVARIGAVVPLLLTSCYIASLLQLNCDWIVLLVLRRLS